MSRIAKNHNILFGVLLIVQILCSWSFLEGMKYLSENNFTKTVKYLLMLIACFWLLQSVMKKHLKILSIQVLWLVWIITMLLLAIPDIVNPYHNYFNLKSFFSTLLFVWLTPLFMLIEPSISFYRKTFRMVWTCVLIYIVFSVFLFLSYPEQSEGFTFLLGGGLPLLLLTLPYHSKGKSYFIIIAFIIVMVLMMLVGRRNKFIYFGSAFVIATIINVLSVPNIKNSRRFGFIIMILAFFVGLVITSDTIFGSFFKKMDSGMESRETVIELFIDDFNKTPGDWVFGRGIYGQVDGGKLNNDETGLRDGIENGYLYLILKGGGLWLIFLVLVAFPAMYKGFFRSNNILCKGFAGIILVYFVDMIGFGIPGVSVKYIMVYLSIAGCNTKWLRQCPDQYLAKEIGLK